MNVFNFIAIFFLTVKSVGPYRLYKDSLMCLQEDNDINDEVKFYKLYKHSLLVIQFALE